MASQKDCEKIAEAILRQLVLGYTDEPAKRQKWQKYTNTSNFDEDIRNLSGVRLRIEATTLMEVFKQVNPDWKKILYEGFFRIICSEGKMEGLTTLSGTNFPEVPLQAKRISTLKEEDFEILKKFSRRKVNLTQPPSVVFQCGNDEDFIEELKGFLTLFMYEDYTAYKKGSEIRPRFQYVATLVLLQAFVENRAQIRQTLSSSSTSGSSFEQTVLSFLEEIKSKLVEFAQESKSGGGGTKVSALELALKEAKNKETEALQNLTAAQKEVARLSKEIEGLQAKLKGAQDQKEADATYIAEIEADNTAKQTELEQAQEKVEQYTQIQKNIADFMTATNNGQRIVEMLQDQDQFEIIKQMFTNIFGENISLPEPPAPTPTPAPAPPRPRTPTPPPPPKPKDDTPTGSDPIKPFSWKEKFGLEFNGVKVFEEDSLTKELPEEFYRRQLTALVEVHTILKPKSGKENRVEEFIMTEPIKSALAEIQSQSDEIKAKPEKILEHFEILSELRARIILVCLYILSNFSMPFSQPPTALFQNRAFLTLASIFFNCQTVLTQPTPPTKIETPDFKLKQAQPGKELPTYANPILNFFGLEEIITGNKSKDQNLTAMTELFGNTKDLLFGDYWEYIILAQEQAATHNSKITNEDSGLSQLLWSAVAAVSSALVAPRSTTTITVEKFYETRHKDFTTKFLQEFKNGQLFGLRSTRVILALEEGKVSEDLSVFDAGQSQVELRSIINTLAEKIPTEFDEKIFEEVFKSIYESQIASIKTESGVEEVKKSIGRLRNIIDFYINLNPSPETVVEGLKARNSEEQARLLLSKYEETKIGLLQSVTDKTMDIETAKLLFSQWIKNANEFLKKPAPKPPPETTPAPKDESGSASSALSEDAAIDAFLQYLDKKGISFWASSDLQDWLKKNSLDESFLGGGSAEKLKVLLAKKARE